MAAVHANSLESSHAAFGQLTSPGSFAVEQAKRLKDLEQENSRLCDRVADLSLEKQILKNVVSGNL
jgi:hypothetical protein